MLLFYKQSSLTPDTGLVCGNTCPTHTTSKCRTGHWLCVCLLCLLSCYASAQTVRVGAGWALTPTTPTSLSAGDTFRLLAATEIATFATSTEIAFYNRFAQNTVSSSVFGHPSIRPYGALFRALVSTSSVDARDNTNTNTNTIGNAGVPIYWLDGDKVADDYMDFYDGSWDQYEGRDTSGNEDSPFAWTGSNNDGTKSSNPLGSSEVTIIDPFRDREGMALNNRLFQTENKDAGMFVDLSILILSPIFEVTTPVAVRTKVYIEGPLQ